MALCRGPGGAAAVLIVLISFRAARGLSLASVTSKQQSAWMAIQGGRSAAATRTEEVILVDGDNVRGKSGWACKAAQLSVELSRGLFPQPVVLFLDHGEHREAFGPSGASGRMALAFAGPNSTADDAIVDSVDWFLSTSKASVAVVTSDYGLRQRLTALGVRARRTAQGGSRLRYVHAHRLVDALSPGDSGPADDALPEYVASFDATYERLAAHVRREAQKRQRATRTGGRRPGHTPAAAAQFPLAEQTWMRVVLAERLRLVAGRQARDDGLVHLLANFTQAFSWPAPEDAEQQPARQLLSHPLSDRTQRRDLVSFVDSLRSQPPQGPSLAGDDDDDDDDQRAPVEVTTHTALLSSSATCSDDGDDHDLPPSSSSSSSRQHPARLVRPLSRRRRRRLKNRGPALVAAAAETSRNYKRVSALLRTDRDDLEAAIARWLRLE